MTTHDIQEITQDFTTCFTVNQTPLQVFAAINNVRDWWAGDIAGKTHHVGDEFTYHFQNFHYSRQRVVESVPGQRVVWLVVEGSINFVDDKAEWDGTRVIFDISDRGGQTELRFTHEGLVPPKACYDDCSGAWGSIINNSLKDCITKA